jgi:hypothetical protein
LLKARNLARFASNRGGDFNAAEHSQDWKTSLGGVALISIGVLGGCGISIPGVNVDFGVALMVGVPLLRRPTAPIHQCAALSSILKDRAEHDPPGSGGRDRARAVS